MLKKMYEVKNKFKDVRKFRDRLLGVDILVEPGKTVLTSTPPSNKDVWDVTLFVEKDSTESKGGRKKVKNKNISNKLE